MHASAIVRTAALAVLLTYVMAPSYNALHLWARPGHVVKARLQAAVWRLRAKYALVPEQEAQDIFGDADELLEDFRAHARPRQQEPLDEDEDLDAEDLGDDDEARADRLRAIVSLPALCPNMSDSS